MTQELVKVERPSLPEHWDYEESVEKVKGFIYKWKNLTIDIAQELWIAREKLRAQGERTDLTSGKNTRSWTIYCKDIGSSRRVVNNWLNRFFSPEPKILPEITGPYDETADIRLGKFEELEKDIPDNSIDAIITDPPYAEEYLHVWEDLSRIGSRILKPSGWLITYVGKLYFPAVIAKLNENLEYYWLLALKLQGVHCRVHPRKVFEEYRPILVFQKQPFRRTDDYFGDLIIGSGRDKSLHKWQQNTGGVEKIIEIFTKPRDLILDPYAGSGTFLIVAQQLGRKIMGIDKDLECIKIMKSRLYKEKHPEEEKNPFPEDKYRIIYADPPWQYGDKLTKSYGVAEHHYPTMNIEELCYLPVKDLADDDAVLFLWITSPILPECFEVIKAWGFKYKTSIVWNKKRHNYGHYVSVRHEFLLICTKGSCHPDIKELPKSVVEIERSTRHSEKPEYFREIIDKMYPHGKRIELFARQKPKEGWDYWGNEI